MSIIINAFLSVAILVLNIYSFIIIVSAILSFVNPDPYNPIVKFVRQVTEPVFYKIRQLMPFVVISNIDLSPLVVLFAINILINILSRMYM